MGTLPLLTGVSNAGWVGRNRDSETISGFIVWCQHCNQPAVINKPPQDHGPASCDTIAGSKRPSLLMAGNNNEVYDKKSERYAKDNRTAFNRTQ